MNDEIVPQGRTRGREEEFEVVLSMYVNESHTVRGHQGSQIVFEERDLCLTKREETEPVTTRKCSVSRITGTGVKKKKETKISM